MIFISNTWCHFNNHQNKYSCLCIHISDRTANLSPHLMCRNMHRDYSTTYNIIQTSWSGWATHTCQWSLLDRHSSAIKYQTVDTEIEALKEATALYEWRAKVIMPFQHIVIYLCIWLLHASHSVDIDIGEYLGRISCLPALGMISKSLKWKIWCKVVYISEQECYNCILL